MSREEGGTYWHWWAAPTLPFVRVGVGVTSSSLFVVVGIGVASSSSSVFILCGPHSLLSIVHCCPSFVRVHHALLSGLASLALRLAVVEVEGAGRQRSCMVDAGGVVLVGCVHPVVARGGRVWVSWALVIIWACCVLRASLLPLFVGRGILLGHCCRSWTAGVVSPTFYYYNNNSCNQYFPVPPNSCSTGQSPAGILRTLPSSGKLAELARTGRVQQDFC